MPSSIIRDSARQRIWFEGTKSQGTRSVDNIELNSQGDMEVNCNTDMTQDMIQNIVNQSTPMKSEFGNMTEESVAQIDSAIIIFCNIITYRFDEHTIFYDT